ncbi:MAG: alpha/beta hydrolase fold domain-containing protein, partial [Candidatus Nanopelagicales bacterium]
MENELVALPATRGASSLQAQVVQAVFRFAVRPVLRRIPIAGWPISLASATEAAMGALPTPAGVTVEQVGLPGFDAEIVWPSAGGSDLARGVVLYFHGGAFLIGGLNSHRRVVAGLARRTGLPVVHVAYRQLPRTSIRGSLEDCVTAYRWLLRSGADPETVVVAGDSAGGFLAFASILATREAGLA